MTIEPIQTRPLIPPRDDLLEVMRESIQKLREKSVVVITSKVVSIWEGRCISMQSVKDKDTLIIQEADQYLPRAAPFDWVMHTIKNNLFIPTAGIDESNAAGHYILWPRNPKRTAKKLWQWLRATYGVKDIGVIITDSHTIPLRRGVMGISLAHWGFSPLNDYRGKPDIFGRELKMTQTDVADGLAASAVLVMGEGSERTPLAVITEVPFVQFCEKPRVSRKPFSSFEIHTKDDLYYPLFAHLKWRKGKGGR